MDIFERIVASEGGPLGQYRKRAHGYYTFPKLEGEIQPYMTFNGKKVLAWTFNNYLGLANDPEVRKQMQRLLQSGASPTLWEPE